MPSVAALTVASALPRHEAQRLIESVSGLDRVAQITHPERELSDEQCALANDLFARRRAGEPLAYMLGEREFWGLSLKVTADVLIPRAETELLVELALERLPAAAPVRVLDLGTGSGAIAVALAHERPLAEITAIDISERALAVAQHNALRHKVKVSLVQSDWFSAFAGAGQTRFDLIVGNPPYIAGDDPHLDRGDLRHEPPGALVASAEGLSDLAAIVARARRHLSPGGWLLLEHGFSQGGACKTLFEQAGFVMVQTWPDLAGLARVTGGCIDAALAER